MKTKIVLLTVLVLVLSFFVGRGVWEVKAAQLAPRVNATFADQNATTDVTIAQIAGEIKTFRRLSSTCLLVAECTPSQHINGIKFADLEEQKIPAFVKYTTIKAQALQAYAAVIQTQGQDADKMAALQALKGPYLAAHQVVYDLNSQITSLGPVPAKLRPSAKLL